MNKGFEDAEKCNVEDTVEFLGRRHMLRLIAMFMQNDRPCRYKTIKDKLKINSKTLTDRLKELAHAGLIRRHSYETIPPRVDYQLTEVGEKLRPIIMELNKFELKYVREKQDLVNVEPA